MRYILINSLSIINNTKFNYIWDNRTRRITPVPENLNSFVQMSKMLFFAQNRRMGPPPQFSVQPTSLSFGFNASSKRLTINSNYPWSYVSGETSWCTIDTKSGDGEGADTINVSVTKNTSTSKTRSATLLFRNEKGLEARVSVSQAVHESYTLSVSPSSVTLQKDSGSQATITISANQGWTISGVPSWASVSKNSGSGSDTVTITASSENTSTDERSAVITVTGNTSGSDTVTIRQSATPIVWSVSPQSISLEANDTSDHTITVTSNTSWTISDYPDWVQVSKSSGTGNDTVNVKAKEEYTGDSQRSGEIVFKNAKDSTITVTIRQSATPIVWSVSPQSISLEANDTSDHTITVTSNTSWTISDYPEWVEVSKTSGSGSDTVTVKAKEEYTGDSQRSGEIVFKNAKNSTITVSITQSAANITYADPIINIQATGSIPASGEEIEVAYIVKVVQTYGYNGATTGGGTIEWNSTDETPCPLSNVSVTGYSKANVKENYRVYASADNLGTTVKEQTTLASATLQGTMNGKTGSATFNIIQEANVESVSFDDTPWISFWFQGYQNTSSVTVPSDTRDNPSLTIGIIITSKCANTYTSGSIGEYDFLPEEATSTIQIPGSVDWAEISSQGGHQAGVIFEDNPGEARSCSVEATFSYKGSSKSYTISVTQEANVELSQCITSNPLI